MIALALALAHTAPYDSEIAVDSALPAASLAKLTFPTLVLNGTASFAWVAETARAPFQALPNAQAVHLEGQPHSPAPDALAPALLLIDATRALPAQGRTIVTVDADFHAPLALSNATSPSTIRVPIEGLRGDELAALVQRVVTLCEADLRAGAMVTVDETTARVRGLHLVR